MLNIFAKQTLKIENTMKRMILNITIIAFIAYGFTACKDKGTDANVSDAKEVIEPIAIAIDFNVNTTDSQILWKGSKPLGTHHGTIKLASGTISVVGNTVQAGKFSIDMNSLTNLDLEGQMKTNLENHLKGTVEGKEADFFNVTEYPFSFFELTGVSEKDGKTMISGNLTMKDKTNNIEFPATIELGDYDLTIKSEPFVLDRTLWGINYGSKTIFDNLGDKFISNDIELTFELVANKS